MFIMHMYVCVCVCVCVSSQLGSMMNYHGLINNCLANFTFGMKINTERERERERERETLKFVKKKKTTHSSSHNFEMSFPNLEQFFSR